MTQIQNRTREQQDVVARLADDFNIDPEKILFLNRDNPLEPWLNYKALVAVARQSELFQEISERFVEFIVPLSQVVHEATIVDPDGRTYRRSGVAMIGETLPNEAVPDEHALAAARAMRAALDDAGFDPTKAAPAVLEFKSTATAANVDEEAEARERGLRKLDLARIHILATEQGLIVPIEGDEERNNADAYRQFLLESFGVRSVVGMGPADRARVINALNQIDARRRQQPVGA
jgi:hypothetical protein